MGARGAYHPRPAVPGPGRDRARLQALDKGGDDRLTVGLAELVGGRLLVHLRGGGSGRVRLLHKKAAPILFVNMEYLVCIKRVSGGAK